MTQLAGKVAVVTGAGRPAGLGAAIVTRLASAGCLVVLSDVGTSADPALPADMIGTDSEMERVAAAIRARTGARIATFSCDVRDPARMDGLGEFAVRTFGALDIWVNNAGIGYLMQPLLEVTAAEWRAVIDVNLTGCFNGIQAAARRMIAAGRGGRIINIASQAAKSGFPYAAAYCASKHGLVGLTRSAATELGPHGITVNNVCPNHVTTGLGAWQNEYFSSRQGLTREEYLERMRARIPIGRLGLPEDTAGVVAFLCSAEAAYITAESLNVSGGEESH
jgi:meso-butanediol dehydrogenase/(S,S)-butanediol dehydrogenase/diacetyl reductase